MAVKEEDENGTVCWGPAELQARPEDELHHAAQNFAQKDLKKVEAVFFRQVSLAAQQQVSGSAQRPSGLQPSQAPPTPDEPAPDDDDEETASKHEGSESQEPAIGAEEEARCQTEQQGERQNAGLALLDDTQARRQLEKLVLNRKDPVRVWEKSACMRDCTRMLARQMLPDACS